MAQQTPAQTRAPAVGEQRAAAGGGKLTNADYMRLTPPVSGGVRYQLIGGELIEMSGAILAHQIFAGRFYIALTLPTDALGIGEVVPAPYDVHIDEFNTYQPDLLFVSSERRGILERLGAFGAPDVVVEILSDSTRRRDLGAKLPVYLRAGVREVVIVDLEARTVAVYAGYGVGDGNGDGDGDGDGDGVRAAARPARVYGVGDTLTLTAMPGVSVELGPIFARALGTA